MRHLPLLVVPALALVLPASALATENACAAAKKACVARSAQAVLGCYAKDGKSADAAKFQVCLDKAHEKFDGGAEAAKACFAKAEAKYPGECLTTGDTEDLQLRIDAFAAEAACALDAGTCAPAFLPKTCLEVRTHAIDTLGSPPADGAQTLFVDGDAAKPWTAYCRGMSFANPTDYISVDPDDNFSTLSDGASLTVTRFTKLRVLIDTWELDLLDFAFAQTTESGPPPPGSLSAVPAGFVQFGSANAGDGPPAEAELELDGTAFVFASSILTFENFCTTTNDEQGELGDNAQVAISADRSLIQMSVVEPVAGDVTKVVADCANLGVPNGSITQGRLPLEYVGE